MEYSSIKFGLSTHFPRLQWEKEKDYLTLCVKLHEKNLQIHDKAVSSAFQNILAFLKSINKTDRPQSARIYNEILQDDPNNLNALVGLHEITLSPSTKTDCERNVKEIMQSEIKKTAIPKTLLEIGVALCLLIPRYHFKDAMSDGSGENSNTIEFDDYENLVFQTENITLDVDLDTNTYIAQKKRVHSSIQYLKEGIERMNALESEQNQTDLTVWKYFLAMAYNRLDHWIDQTRGSTMLRKQFSLSSLELFCEITASSDPNSGDTARRMYFQRSLAYIGQILVTRKDVLKRGEMEKLPDVLMRYERQGHFIRQLWDEPKQSFERALEYGYDPIVYTRYAKCLLHDDDYNRAIEHINEVFENGDGNWFAASTRLNAYKIMQTEKYKRAKQSQDFPSLTKDCLLKAEKDGKYCFDTIGTAKGLSRYAAILRWLGTFPDGETVTDKNKIQRALIILDRIYKEEGCHTHPYVHKIMAECHKDMGDLDEAIKYAIWALNSTPYIQERIPPSFSFLIYLLFEKFVQDSVTEEEKHCLLRQIRYYIDSEIDHRCHKLIKEKFQDIKLKDVTLYNKVQTLLREYNKKNLNEIKDAVTAETFSGEHHRDHYLNVCINFDILFSIVRTSCRRFPGVVKRLLDFTIDLAAKGPVQTFVTMSLICLGRDHTEYTRQYNRKLKTRAQGSKLFQLDLFTSPLEKYPEKESFKFLIIHAPEDKDWVFYIFLPEMEQRPIKFEGCIPDRDFKKEETFEKNVLVSLAKTRKVLLVLTPNFLKRFHELLGGEVLKKLEEKNKNKEIDVIMIFKDAIKLNLEEHAVLAEFDNVHSSSNGLLEWNYLRKRLLRPIRPLDTTRDAVKWKADMNGNNMLPHGEEDDELYKKIAQDILPYGVPQAVYILYHKAFIIGYDGEKRVPRWVAHKIDRDVERGVVSRTTDHKLRNYTQDLTIPPQARSSKKDFQGREDVDKGHMTPLADHSSSLEKAKDTNILTNIVPESKNNFLWTRLEEYCRDRLTTTFETIYVMSGTLFLPSKHEDGREYVNYEVIGKNKVAKPTHLFKIIVAKQSGKSEEVGAFLVRNIPLQDEELTDLSVSISWLENQNGIELFRGLDSSVKKSERTTLTVPFFPKEERKRKMIRKIDNIDSLESIWENLTPEEKSKLKPIYDDKKKRLKDKTKRLKDKTRPTSV